MSTQSVVIAGNGPSLTAIDYRRLPEQFDVFRCNQFYFEDAHYLGQNVKAVFFNSSVFFEQFYTAMLLSERNEYRFEKIILSDYGNPLVTRDTPTVEAVLPQITNGYKAYLSKLEAFDNYLRFNELYRSQRPTAGVYMVAVAAAMGYKDIYLAGIDFYRGDKSQYAFDHQKDNIVSLVPNFKEDQSHAEVHGENFELDALQFLMNHYGLRLFTVCPESPAADTFPLAPVQSEGHFEVKKKAPGAIKDIQLPPASFYQRLAGLEEPLPHAHRGNLIVWLLYDLLTFPKGLRRYFRDKRLRKEKLRKARG